jgi:RNA polymerase sigma factor (sigma-70 family)
MAIPAASRLLRQLTRSMVAERVPDRSDRQLVEQLLAGPDEAAFEAIVRRHGPMVYQVCWRILGREQDAEDVFQATFLILAQKLCSVRKHASLASWLHGVARRVALKARAQSWTRHQLQQHAESPAIPPDDITRNELRTVLDAELQELPEKWRLPLILCFLEGRTQDEAAIQLGWSARTVRRRLDEAKTALGHRLIRRGIVWPAAMSAVLLSQSITTATMAPGMMCSTIGAAAGVAGGRAIASVVSVRTATLVEGVLKTMFMTKLKAAASVVTLTAIFAVGGGFLVHQTAVGQGQPANPVVIEADTAPRANRQEPSRDDETKHDARLERLAEDLELAKEKVRQAKKDLDAAASRLLEVHERYETAKMRGKPKPPKIEQGTLVLTKPGENSVRLEMVIERTVPYAELWGGSTVFAGRVYETYRVAGDALILQDNAKTKLADLKMNSRLTLTFAADGMSVVRIDADGGATQGRLLLLNTARNTIRVTVGEKDTRVYHLVKETQVLTTGGKAVGITELKEGTMLQLTKSVEDANTVIRIEPAPEVNKDR